MNESHKYARELYEDGKSILSIERFNPNKTLEHDKNIHIYLTFDEAKKLTSFIYEEHKLADVYGLFSSANAYDDFLCAMIRVLQTNDRDKESDLIELIGLCAIQSVQNQINDLLEFARQEAEEDEKERIKIEKEQNRNEQYLSEGVDRT